MQTIKSFIKDHNVHVSLDTETVIYIRSMHIFIQSVFISFDLSKNDSWQAQNSQIQHQRYIFGYIGYLLCILTNQALILKRIFLKDCLSMILLLVFFGNYDYGVAWWQNHFVARSQTVWKICSEYSMYDKNNT